MMQPRNRQKAARALLRKLLDECAIHCRRSVDAFEIEKKSVVTIIRGYADDMEEAQTELVEAQLAERPA